MVVSLKMNIFSRPHNCNDEEFAEEDEGYDETKMEHTNMNYINVLADNNEDYVYMKSFPPMGAEALPLSKSFLIS